MIPDSDSVGTLSLIDLITMADRLDVTGRKSEALELYEAWIRQSDSPLRYVASFNLGAMYSAQADIQRAKEAYERSLEQYPDFMQARLNLGSILEQQGREDEALEQWRLALLSREVDKPGNLSLRLHALNNLGRLLEKQRQFSPALEVLEQSLALDFKQTDVMIHLVHLTQKICKWPIYAPPEGMTKEELVKGTSPLAMLAASDDPEAQLACSRRFVQYKYPCEAVEPLAPPGGYRHDKIRIGYLSSNLSTHAVSLLTVELFELHDRSRFEVYGFCWSHEDGTAFRQRVINGFDHFIRIGALGDKEAAECIRSHEIDILVDLHGLTSGARPLILSYRPAPVQATYLGFPGPTGIPWIDYVVADRYMIPEEESRYYGEKPLYLPNCFQASDSKRQVAPMPKRADYFLPDDAFVYCTFNNNYKYTPEMFAAWMRILGRVPKSVLWLLSDNQWVKENLCRSAKEMGIGEERLIFAPRAVPEEYLARYQLADLFLDTYPFNGGTTANDALFMGLPLLTLSGRTFASRYAGSLLTHLGIPELITTRLSDYEKKAVKLAGKGSDLGRIRKLLRQRIKTSPVFDMPRLTKDLETAYMEAVREQHRPSGHLPASQPDRDESVMPVSYGNTATAPYFSIVIPTHNRPQLLERALTSVRNQSFGNVEIVVVSDTSAPATYEAAGRHLTDRDIFIKRSGAPGPAVSRNLGIDHASGEYLIFLDDDDTLDDGYLEKLHEECEKQRGIVLFCNFHVVMEERQSRRITTLSEKLITISSFLKSDLYLKKLIANNALVYPRLLLQQKRFDAHLKLHEDWDFLLNVLEDAELRFIDMAGPRVHNDDPKLLKRLGSLNYGAMAMDMIHVYRRWPGKSGEIKLKRQQFLQQNGINVPIECL